MGRGEEERGRKGEWESGRKGDRNLTKVTFSLTKVLIITSFHATLVSFSTSLFKAVDISAPVPCVVIVFRMVKESFKSAEN